MRSVVVMSGFALLLAGCATRDPQLAKAYIDANLPPDYRSLIVDRVKHDFFDPYSIRSAGISEPRAWGNLILVCIEANAKNRMGGYTGIEQTVFQFKHGELRSWVANNPYLCPGDLTYKAFPDLENLK